MLVHLDVLKYLQRTSPNINNFEDKDAYTLINWFVYLESSARILRIENLTDYAITLLRNEYAAWTLYQEFDSWEHFKYELVNKIFPFRLDLGNQISAEVNVIKALIDNQDTKVFASIEKFAFLMNELYKTIAPFEIWLQEHEVLGNISTLEELFKNFRESRIDLYRLYFKNTNDLTAEEEEKVMTDKDPATFWIDFKTFISSFLNSALAFGLCADRQTKSVESFTIDKLAGKIMNNI